MATSLQRLASNSGKAYRSALAPLSRAFSTADSLVEVKPGEIGMVSGIPQEHIRRRVQIFSPARTASQQGSGKVGRWKINFISTQKYAFFSCLLHFTLALNLLSAGRCFDELYIGKFITGWENPLMGWTSTGDPYANVGDSALSFDSQEAAISFAERHGWEYTVKKHQTPLLKVKSYADNFKWKGPPKTQN
ncbi:hypothetical protein DH2020_041011 [Rehmannia glutinosa]|uniref:NADH dehydrogenase [ubiquinone] iron-sulfur protein 4, mitochondrial n=1 Tax=Rehmannia glutinosa TaxID=99300 RepID=A0ABR0URL1_REHGL